MTKKILSPALVLFSLFMAAACTHQPAPPKAEQRSDSPPAYNYPIHNPYAATVIGVPPEMRVHYDSVPELKDKTLLFDKRHIPEGFWYDRGLKYSEILQNKPAPLVYIIAGTGGDNHATTSIAMADMLYSAGFSVVLLPSPSHPDFIINASENFLPGRPSQDGKDLCRVIKRIDPEIASHAKVTSRMLIGYSLGAIDALFAYRFAEAEDSMHFQKLLLINPPLNLYSSMQALDNMLYRSLPHGVNDADQFIKTTVQRLSRVQQSNEALDFSNERLLIKAYTDDELSNNRLATMIGISFRLAAANMIFTADVMGHDGYIFPKNREFKTSTPLNDYMAVALRTSFKDYFDQLYTEKTLALEPSLSAPDLIREGNLESYAGYLARHKNIAVLTNADDVILAPGEYHTLVTLFGGNAITFPSGGHLGNLEHPAVAYRIIHFMKQ